MRVPLPTIAAIALLSGPALHAADRPVDRALAAWRSELGALRIDESDLALPAAQPPFHPVASVEAFFSTPTAFPPAASGWLDEVETAAGLALQARLGGRILFGETADVPEVRKVPTGRTDLPPEIEDATALLIGAVSAARAPLDAARGSLTDDRRSAFAAMFGWGQDAAAAESDLSTRRLRDRLAALNGYGERDMHAASLAILAGVDAAIGRLYGGSGPVRRRVRFATPAGDVLIGRSGDDVYRARDLDGVAILIEPGGDNTYESPVAFAGPGEARVVIDFGENVLVQGSRGGGPGAGAAFFGVAVMALPNPAGLKRITTGDHSQGASIGGLGALLVNGSCDLYAGRYSQGAGVAGVGILIGAGDSSRYESYGSGQGAGFTRGVGIFRHRGDGAAVRGGLVEPDPREPKGAVSLCQGVGVGRRAFSGGGVGLCSLAGDGIVAMASYFAQGSGYWHAAGAFRLRGNRNTVQGRRYSLGSGTHSAFGHFESVGNRNRILNWGVGPSHGWDRGVGSAVVSGDATEVQAEWGTGTASIGSRAFGYYEGSNGRLRLPWTGSGQWFRNESAYSLQMVAGGPHRIQGIAPLDRAVSGRLLGNLWGVATIEEAILVRELQLIPPEWPEFEREPERRRQAVDLRRELAAAAESGPADRVAALVDIAAAFTLDRETPRLALAQLFSLPPDELPHLAAAIDPAAIEQLIQISMAVAAHGDEVAGPLAGLPPDSPAAPVATGLLRLLRPSVALPLLEPLLDGGGARTAAAVRSIGGILNRDTGEEPGARAVLEAVGDFLEKPHARHRAAVLAILSRMRFTEALGALSTAAGVGPEERVELLRAGPEDLTDKTGDAGAAAFLKIVESSPGSRARISDELRAAKAAEPRVRPMLRALARSTDTAAAQAAIVAAGQIGHPGDAGWIYPLMEHRRGIVRESAAVSLGRLGEAGTPYLMKAARSRSARTRALAAVGAGNGVDESAARVIDTLLSDRDPMVAAAAMAALRSPTDGFRGEAAALKKKAARRSPGQPTGRDFDINLRVLLLP